jgi:hypothetical protein
VEAVGQVLRAEAVEQALPVPHAQVGAVVLVLEALLAQVQEQAEA